MAVKVYYSDSPAQTRLVAAEIAKDIKDGSFVALYGEMGAGKTAFTQGFVDAVAPECSNRVHSPTFAVVNEYIGESRTVCHFDFYRLTDYDDLVSTGFYDYNDGKKIIITEWSELFSEIVPADAVLVKLEILSETERRIEVCKS